MSETSSTTSTPAVSGQASATGQTGTGHSDVKAAEKQNSDDAMNPQTKSKKSAVAENEQKQVSAPVHKYADKLLKVYSDRKFEKPEDFDVALDEYLNELEDYKERGSLANQKLIAAFESDPSVGEILKDYVNGASFRSAIARHLSPEDLIPQEGDADYDQWAKNKKEREELFQKRKRQEEERGKNIEESRKVINEFAQKNKLDDKAINEFLEKVDNIINSVYEGRITHEFLDFMNKALNFEKEMAKAIEEERIKLNNQKILVQKEGQVKTGDGLPNLKKIITPDDGIVKKQPHLIDRIVERAKSRSID